MSQAKEYKFLPKITSTNPELVAEGYKFKNISPRNVVGEMFNAEAILYNEFFRKSVWRSRWFLGMLVPVAAFGIQKAYFKGLQNPENLKNSEFVQITEGRFGAKH